MNSIIALETGTIENDSSLLKWDGKRRQLKIWEQDLSLKQAFRFSCLPCYQEIARKIGVEQMNNYIAKLNYGTIKVDSTSFDKFWLEGDTWINQFQQIDFLRDIHQSKLPISDRTARIIKKIMIIEKKDNYILRGKTGWSINNKTNNGWFVGYIEVQNKTYFFATNIEPKLQFDMNLFAITRKNVTFDAFKQMGIIK